MAKKKGPGPMQKAAEAQRRKEAEQKSVKDQVGDILRDELGDEAVDKAEAAGREGIGGSPSRKDEKREVTEVKYKPKDKLVRIGYDEPHGSDIHSIVLESKDEPKACFKAALQALGQHAASICEIEDPDWIEGVTVLGVKMKPRRDGFGAVISCTNKLQSKAVMCFNTPFLPESAEHGPTLPPIVMGCLRTLMAEALAYVDGKRAQGELFESGE